MKTKITLLLLIFTFSYSFSQKRVADKFFRDYAYVKAAEFYENAVKKGDSTSYTLARLGDCYYNNSDSKQAVYWYQLASESEEGLSKENIQRYVQALRSIGEYEKADKWLEKLPDAKGGVSKEDYENLMSLNNDTINIYNLEINTKNSDFGPYVRGNTFVFSSAKNKKGKIYEWNNEPYLDLYEAKINVENGLKTIEDVAPIASSKINTSFHESSVAITKDGSTMYFTRNNLNKRDKLDYDKEGTSHLKIYKATLVNGQWDNIEELSLNDEVYSSGHPALSPDEKTLYFTSDRPGGYGLTDIYKVAILPDRTYGAPVNMGDKINTTGREMFPFVAKDYTLYFSSDGYANLGLLDIYKSSILNNNSSEVKNIGAPFNSGYDDFAFFLNEDNKTGYFSSNRPGGKGHDDIYSFEKCKQFISGKVFDEKTKELLSEALVELVDSRGKVLETITTQADGSYFFEVNCGKKYVLRGSKSDYKDDLKDVLTTNDDNKNIELDLYLTSLIIGDEIVINPIFFDFDKWNIRPDAAYELEHIVQVLKNHPRMNIKIESHTDSRGSDSYNEVLSDKRAKSTRDYIFSRGIATNRIESAIGYGEKHLVNKCSSGVPCTKEEHQENRRSKFIIINDYK
ncbi:OmpA family protein [Tenacibaculum sp. 47A_GOM-205m]|uniref:OmpA family protein n=1 Tax=Tenacibaculum sp. 47A_GOM-205m TaxID=1380384 RepID=UPI00048FFF09|nr:OmpA family protein [Tenacibaculum sp. 47A_GOM-205m]